MALGMYTEYYNISFSNIKMYYYLIEWRPNYFIGDLTFYRYGIAQVQPKVVFTSYHLVPRLISILATYHNNISHIIYFEHPLKKMTGIISERSDTNVFSASTISFAQLELNGLSTKVPSQASSAGKSKYF